MAKFDIEKLITKHTKDGNVDYTSLNEDLESQNRNIVASEVKKEANKYDKDLVIKEFLEVNEFKSIDEFNAFKKSGATADTEAVKRLEKELNDFKTKYEELVPLKAENTTYKNRETLRSKGTFTKDELDFIEFKINRLDGETFEEKLSAFVETNPDAFTPATPVLPKNVISTTGTKINHVTSEKLPFEKILEDKYGELK